MPYGAPVSLLDDLIDVTGAGTVEGDMLYFDALSGTFMVGARPNLAELLANTLILNDIGDVNIPAPASLDFMYWDDTAGIWVNISYANLLASIQGDTKLDDLADVNVPTPGDGNVLYWDDAASKWKDKAEAVAVVGEGHITILPFSYDSIGQGTWAFTSHAGLFFGGSIANTSSTDGDNLSYKVYLDVGTYALLLFTRTHPGGPIVDFDIDAVEVASFDDYSNPGVNNVIFTQTGIIISTPGLKTLKARVDGKNASSSAYLLYLTYMALWRTA